MTNRHGIPVLPPIPRKKNARVLQAQTTSRGYIFSIYGGKCHYCGTKLMSFKKAKGAPNHLKPTIDHKVPRSAGGKTRPGNLILACANCNSRKGSRDYAEFVAEMTRGVC